MHAAHLQALWLLSSVCVCFNETLQCLWMFVFITNVVTTFQTQILNCGRKIQYLGLKAAA